ncbi:hypothetical protein [Brevundimonas sp. TSRC1-1]|uniref:hypothetical protein n=1 Tax=Brevundimonas sp. TSRC1-1 TaxID=2804562 RepID=UPI003CEE26BE
MADDLAALKRLHAKGVSFIANVPTVYGGKDLIMGPQEAYEFSLDRDAAAARMMGVTKEVYVEWLAAGGDVQCAGTTKSGRRCRNSISGGAIYDPVEWEREIRINAKCVIHGGPPGVDQ